MNSVKTTLPSLRSIEWRTLKTETNKINQIIPYILTNNITELNDLIDAGAKLVCEKIGGPHKNHEGTIKTRMGSSTGNRDKQSSKTGQNWKKKERTWNMWEENGKDNTGKNNSTTWGNKPEGSCERRETKEISKKGIKEYRQNRTFQSNERKFYQQLGGHDTKTYQQPDATETEQFWTKIWQPKKHNKQSQNVQNITRNHKLHRKKHEKLESWINSRRKKAWLN